MIIDCISDLHGHYPKLDGGDLLIVAGDLTASHKAVQFLEFFLWLDKQNYRKKIVIAGNHDNILQKIPPTRESLPDNTSYLCDSGTEFEGYKIWGSPWTLQFEGIHPYCIAFTVKTEEELEEKWALIPEDTDILVTHSPPFGIEKLDRIWDKRGRPTWVGSMALLKRIQSIKDKLKLHVFGHVHEGYGTAIRDSTENWTLFVNASHVNRDFEPVNDRIRVSL